MRNNLILFFYIATLMCFSLLSKAQFVSIPDVNFRTYLETNFPACMQGGKMDTTCIDIVNATYMSIYLENISDITGIQYFDRLELLDCSQNQITFLPPLPQFLVTLNCSLNDITYLPDLPIFLTNLNCSMNQITSLPSLPVNLIGLDCQVNKISILPSLPSEMMFLICGYNNIKIMPPLPLTLLRFYCNNNQLTNLPALPPLIIEAGFHHNQIKCLPILPESLEFLYIDSICIPNRPSRLTGLLPFNTAVCSNISFEYTRVCSCDTTSFLMINRNCHSYMWDFDDPFSAHNSSLLQNPKHVFSKSGIYNVKLISYTSNGPIVFSQAVIVDTINSITLGNDHSMCQNDGITLDAGKGFVTYLWQDGSNMQEYQVTTAGTYIVTATNTCGSATDAIRLSEYTLTVPNLFTPNKDGYNETFEIKGLDGDAGSFHVYNSWGAEVYSAEKYYNNWNAEELADGIYYYSFSLKSCPVQKGWLQIIR